MNITDYARAEAAGRARMPNRITEASQCATFDRLGYPTRVNSTAELWRYADAMHELRTRINYDMLGGLTNREFGHLKTITATVRRLTTDLCNRPVIPASSLLQAFLPYRVIRALGSPATLELGPGSGYLGALLLEDEVPYASMENCQAFHIWQSLLLKKAHKQWPWWEWMDADARPNVSLFTANHMLNEMHIIALHYALKRAPDLWVIENFGGPIQRTEAQTMHLFSTYRYNISKVGHVHIAHRGPAPMLIAPEPISVFWPELLAFWGGAVPETADEAFWNFVGAST